MYGRELRAQFLIEGHTVLSGTKSREEVFWRFVNATTKT